MDYSLENMPADPSALPGYSDYLNSNPGLPATLSDFSIEPINPQPQHGVGPGEHVTILFTTGSDLSSVLDAMHNQTLVVGLHATSFANGESEGFITVPHTHIHPVPSPTASLAGLAMLGLVSLRRRRRP